MFEKFTDAARRVVVLAQEEARTLGHPHIGTEHLLLALSRTENATSTQLLFAHGATHPELVKTIERIIGRKDANPTGHIPFTPRAKSTLGLALRESVKRNDSQIDTEHLLLGVLAERDGVAVRVLLETGVDLDAVFTAVTDRLDGTTSAPTTTGGPTPGSSRTSGRTTGATPGTSKLLDQFGINLTARAAAGELDPVIGRAPQIERVIQVLSRRTKNNPCLVGEPGVGKTAIAEGLAQAIVSGEVPETLTDKLVYTLDLSSMVAGARYRGDFEERMKKVLAEIQSRGDIIIFIDETHTLVGAGAAEGSMDAANLLKPVLARGELQTIGATTLDEYRKHIEKDAALERRFQPVQVPEPTVDHTVEILRGLRDRYAAHHGVLITDDALVAAATLSDRYITDRFLPDKAIDLVDEAAAAQQIKGLRRTDQGTDPAAADLSAKIAAARAAKEAAIDASAFEEAAAARDEEKALLAAAEEAAKSLAAARAEGTPEAAPNGVVNEQIVSEVLAAATGIPVVAVTKDETARLLNMEAELHKRVVGQEDAVKAISRAIRRTRAGLKDPRRPGGSFIFAGPSGVGKTWLTKTLAEFLFGDEDSLIALDMSEFAEKHTVARLFGAPPGYVGYEEGGQLTEKVRRKPFSVVLFDEVEKAHPDIFNSLLQILEEGRLTDSQGRVVDFKNTVIIMTTNLGTRDIAKSIGLGFSQASDAEGAYERMKAKVSEELKGHFRPEFLNRVDEIVVFPQLTQTEVLSMVDRMIAGVETRLADRDMRIELTSAAKTLLAHKGFDPLLGARPLRRTIQREIEDNLAEQILFGTLRSGQLVLVDTNAAGEFTFTGTSIEVPDTPPAENCVIG